VGAPRRSLVLMVSLAIWVTGSFLGIRSGDELRYPDEKEYHDLALSLVQHHSYLDERLQPTAVRPPGYPSVLAAVYSFWSRPLAAKLINAFTCALTAIVLSLLVSAIQPGVGGLVAPVLVLCYPLFLYASSTLYPQIAGTLLFVSCLFLLVRYVASWKATIAAGLMFGLLVLTIPSFLYWLPFIPAYLLVADRLGGAPRFRRAAIFSVCAVLAIAPWTLRNFIQLGSWIPVSTNGGINLLLGNSPSTTPDSGVNVDITRYLQQAKGMNEVEQDRFFRQCALAFIRQNPAEAAKLYLKKAASYFSFRNRVYTATESSGTRDAILFLTYYPLLLAALIRLLYRRRYPMDLTEGFLYLLYFGNALLSAIFFTRIRFRIPFDALLMALVAIFASRAWSRTSESREARSGMHLGV